MRAMEKALNIIYASVWPENPYSFPTVSYSWDTSDSDEQPQEYCDHTRSVEILNVGYCKCNKYKWKWNAGEMEWDFLGEGQ